MKQHPTKLAPTSDNRNNIISVWDTEGNELKHTETNARELVRHLNYTINRKEGEARRAAPEPKVVLVNDGTPEATALKLSQPAAPEAPVWEDLTTLGKDTLRAAAAYLKLPDIDGRSSEKRIVATLDAILDQNLSASGDFVGADPVSESSSDEEKAAAKIDAIARRRRAFELAAHSTGVPFGDNISLTQVVTSIASLVEAPKE